MQSRRDVLKKLGAASTAGVAGTAALSGSVSVGMPEVDWEPADPSNYTSGNRGASEINWDHHPHGPRVGQRRGQLVPEPRRKRECPLHGR
ncbi:twin-arginine translocation signal domain-containing protein [Halorussus litoreus]|uniref:twin-arginine translocation signal domain-containing protein n=1 Tax=Halorussus litoreus TaxID=1710536 RepID=UPI001E2F9DA9|nr:twin-arginine translocation signal domain-containing protein [Halorussus litoreus]